MFRRRRPDERIARALMKLLERDVGVGDRKPPELEVSQFEINRSLYDGNVVEFSVHITGRAKYHKNGL